MDRAFEFVVDGSKEAEIVCHKYLEPVANWLVGEPIKKSDTEHVEQQRTLCTAGGVIVELSFSATQLADGEGNSELMYNLSASVSRPFDGTFYWPGHDSFETLTEEGASTEQVLRVPENDEDLDATEGSIKEVWDFYIDDIAYRPRKDIRWEYYDEENNLVTVISANDPLVADRILAIEPQDDTFLKLIETSISHSFSQQDMREIVGILEKFGFRFPPPQEIDETGTV